MTWLCEMLLGWRGTHLPCTVVLCTAYSQFIVLYLHRGIAIVGKVPSTIPVSVAQPPSSCHRRQLSDWVWQGPFRLETATSLVLAVLLQRAKSHRQTTAEEATHPTNRQSATHHPRHSGRSSSRATAAGRDWNVVRSLPLAN